MNAHKKNQSDLVREGIEYSLRKNGVKPTHSLVADILLTFIDGMAHLIAQREVAELKRQSKTKKRAKK